MSPKHKSADVAIIGMGTMGSFAAVELARRGLSVIGFDRFTPPHGRGSHSGSTRIYRIAYPEGTGYVKLAQRAGDLWDAAAEDFGARLLHRTGMLYMGRPDEPLIQEVRDSAVSNQLLTETLTAEEIYRRYPAFEIPEDYTGILDTQAGWIDVDTSITAAHAYARTLGVTCLFEQAVTGWDASTDGVRVHLENETIHAGRLIITAGAWASSLLSELQLPLAIKRKVIAWFAPERPELFAAGRVPVFTFPENFLYGFPGVPGLGVKVAEHMGGSYLAGADGAVAPPGPADLDPITATVAKYMPGLGSRIVKSATCLYTMTSDDDFIVDRHPHFSNVVFAAGFSGHGFKFAPLIAEALADLVIAGKTPLPVEFLSLGRLSSPAREKPGTNYPLIYFPDLPVT
jgi:sarcosine oxidase